MWTLIQRGRLVHTTMVIESDKEAIISQYGQIKASYVSQKYPRNLLNNTWELFFFKEKVDSCNDT